MKLFFLHSIPQNWHIVFSFESCSLDTGLRTGVKLILRLWNCELWIHSPVSCGVVVLWESLEKLWLLSFCVSWNVVHLFRASWRLKGLSPTLFFFSFCKKLRKSNKLKISLFPPTTPLFSPSHPTHPFYKKWRPPIGKYI